MSVDARSAITLSIEVAAASTLLSAPPAIALGWLLARRRFFGKTMVSALVLAPMVLPPVVTGLLLLDVFGRSAPLGKWLADHGMPLSFSLAGAVLAALVVGLPLHVMAARTAFEVVDRRYEEVSRTLGVSRARTFLRVTLPLALPGLAGGAVLAFARALGEFGATVVLAGNDEGKTRTIALAVYSLLDDPKGEAAARALVVASALLSVAALAGYELFNRWQRRRLELDHV